INVDDLDAWLAESYPTAFRTACLVLRSSADAEDAVQDAFLRVWRFPDAIPSGDGRRAPPYRGVVHAPPSPLRGGRMWRERDPERSRPPRLALSGGRQRLPVPAARRPYVARTRRRGVPRDRARTDRPAARRRGRGARPLPDERARAAAGASARARRAPLFQR